MKWHKCKYGRTEITDQLLVDLDNFQTGSLEEKVRALYDSVNRLEDEKYDWEVKLRKLDFDVSNHSPIGARWRFNGNQ